MMHGENLKLTVPSILRSPSENICALETRWGAHFGLQNMRYRKEISICTKTDVYSSQKNYTI